jgi:hypothetical protein
MPRSNVNARPHPRGSRLRHDLVLGVTEGPTAQAQVSSPARRGPSDSPVDRALRGVTREHVVAVLRTPPSRFQRRSQG